MNSASSSFIRDAARAVRNNRHEIADDGAFYIPGSRAFIGGVPAYAYAPPGEGFGPKVFEKPNRVVGQGLNHLLNLLGGHSSFAALYLAPFSGNVSPADGWEADDWVSTATEFTAYAPTTRVPWTTVPATNKSLTNAAALAASTITLNAGGPYTIRGFAVVSSSAKSSGAGLLVAASRFAADVTGLMGGGKLAMEYALAAIDEADQS